MPPLWLPAIGMTSGMWIVWKHLGPARDWDGQESFLTSKQLLLTSRDRTISEFGQSAGPYVLTGPPDSKESEFKPQSDQNHFMLTQDALGTLGFSHVCVDVHFQLNMDL